MKIRLGLKEKLIGGFFAVSLIGAIIGITGVSLLNKIGHADQKLYENMTKPIADLQVISGNFNRVRVNLRDMIRATNESDIQKKADRISVLSNEISVAADDFEKRIISDDIRRAYAEFVSARTAFRQDIAELQSLAQQGNDVEAWQLLDGQAQVTSTLENDAIEKLVNLQIAAAEQTAGSNMSTAKSAGAWMIGLVAFNFLLAVGFGFFLAISITRPLKKVIDASKKIVAGDLTADLNINRKDETGDLAAALKIMVANLSKRVQYLNNIPAPIMVVDKEMNVEFMNKAGADTAGLTPEQCVGKKCYNLFTNPHCQTSDCRTVQAMKTDQVCTGKTVVSARNLNLPIMYTGAPIKDDSGNIIGAFEYVNDISKLEKVSNFQKGEVQKISEILNRMAQGDLTASYETSKPDNDTAEVYEAFVEISKAMKTTLVSFNDILGHVAIAVEQIATGSEQVSDSSQALSQGATEQAGSLQEITSSVTEMASQTKQNAENASSANQLSSSARESAEDGNGKMKRMLDAMAEINQSSNQISKIIKAIDEIAFQTNLLALNAAVEAARAGVHGKGFAVVAEEVRNLAQRSAKAAKETTELIEGSVKRVEGGTGIANETAKALEGIVSKITQVTDLVGEIASASNEQAQGIHQINQGLSQIDQVTQSNTASAEESASAAEELSSQAVQLKQMIAKFHLLNQSTGGGAVISDSNYRPNREILKKKAGGPAWGVKANGGKQREFESANIALDDKEFGSF